MLTAETRAWTLRRAYRLVAVAALAPLLFVPAYPSFAAEMPPASPAPLKQPDAGYKLRAGDEINLAVTPQKSYEARGMILPDGVLYLPRIRPVKAAGLTIPELEAQLRAALSEKLVDPKVAVTIVKLAPAQEAALGAITVVGAVTKPGPQPLTPGLRVRAALDLAGSALKNANLTAITIYHRDLTRTVVDLSSPERISDPLQNRVLADGDSIEVPTLPTRFFALLGAVVRPGMLEFEQGLRLQRALEMAGGATREADLSRVVIYHRDLTRTVVDLSTPERLADATQNLELREGDSIEVPLLARPAEYVRVSGQVINPGQYAHRPGLGLEDAIVLAGKLAPTADVSRVQLRRRGQPDRVIDLNEQLKLGLAGKIALEPEDEVFIPEHKSTVLLLGAVPQPGPVALKPGQTLLELFTQGGAHMAAALDPARADLNAVQVIRGSTTETVNLMRSLKNPRGGKSLALQHGDVVFIPPYREKQKKGLSGFLQQLGPVAGLFALL